MRTKIIAVAFLMGLVTTSSAFAEDHKVDWAKHCKADLEKFKCDANGKDEDIYQCLLKHDSEISKPCDENAHSKYEELTGKK